MSSRVDIQSVKQKFGIAGVSEQIDRAIDIAVKVAPIDASVLVTGESGVGKEFFPKIIHEYSSRKHNKYIAVNCGAIPEGTIESELFGHVKGAFTGAVSDRKGFFEEADGGTIFLDEVGELPLATQVKLLRVIQSGEYSRVGSSAVQKTNVRVVAATNNDLQVQIKNGKFREDLYYRLNTIPIVVPPLRERREDIYPLFRKFAGDIAAAYRMETIRLDEDARRLLENYIWRGNVRQLKNVIEQISAIETERIITAEILEKYLPKEVMTAVHVVNDTASSSSSGLNSERDIFYQSIIDMHKGIMNMQKEIVAILSLLTQQQGGNAQQPSSFQTASSNLLPEVKQHQPECEEIMDVEYDSAHEKSKSDKERDELIAALDSSGGNRKEAANMLNISERTIYRKMEKYGIKR